MLRAPISYLDLKIACRAGLTDEERAYWWPVLPNITKDQDIINEYPDVTGDASRLSALTKFKPGLVATTEEKFNVVMTAVRTAMDNKNGVKEVVLVSTVMRFVCQHVPSVEVCHLIGCDVTSKTNK